VDDVLAEAAALSAKDAPLLSRSSWLGNDTWIGHNQRRSGGKHTGDINEVTQ